MALGIVLRREAEANVTFELAHQLRLLRIDFELECYAVQPVGGRRCRFDLCVFRDGGADDVICIVEVKRSGRAWRRMTGQKHRYGGHGIPLLVCRGKADVARVVEEIKMLQLRTL